MYIFTIFNCSDRIRVCASGSVGGVRPCQGRGRGFESRLALFFILEVLWFTRLFVFYKELKNRLENDFKITGCL